MRKSVKTTWYVAAGLAAILAVNYVYPFVWMLAPVHGRVVDRATGSPIADAAVAVSWSLQSWEGSVVDYLYLGETTTDENGEFRIAVRGLKFHFSEGRVLGTQPEIRVIADGYLPAETRSSADVTGVFFYAGGQHDASVFRLETASPGEPYARAVQNFINYFLFVSANRPCDLQRVPQTMSHVVRARESLATVGLGSALPSGATPPSDCN